MQMYNRTVGIWGIILDPRFLVRSVEHIAKIDQHERSR